MAERSDVVTLSASANDASLNGTGACARRVDNWDEERTA